MLNFKEFKMLMEAAEASSDDKLKHIEHAEDHPLNSGYKGAVHAFGVLQKAHDHVKAGAHSTDLSMKYDGSPSLVYGHHPENNKFFVATKSAFNKTPKINYSNEDIEANHGHAPGLVEKLKSALHHLPKVAPKHGVYQGDVMFTHGDVHHHDNGNASFTPNTITYTAKGKEAEAVKHAKLGLVTHTQYHGNDITDMKASPHPDTSGFGKHKDVFHKTAEHDTSKVALTPAASKEFKGHLDAAKSIHAKHGDKMYDATEKHHGEGGALKAYINHTVRTGETPTHKGLQGHIAAKAEKEIAKVKTEKSKNAKSQALHDDIHHIENNKEHYNNLLKMHDHLQKAKNVLVSTLEQHEGGLDHSINGTKSKPEGFVVHHEGKPTKLVNRAEFARSNMLRFGK
jgi:hypothetical protein